MAAAAGAAEGIAPARMTPARQQWLAALPALPRQAIAECLLRLSIARTSAQFLTLLLMTLSGWARRMGPSATVDGRRGPHPHPVSEEDYLAVRLAITRMLWPHAAGTVDRYAQALRAVRAGRLLAAIKDNEAHYRLPLLAKLAAQLHDAVHTPAAQPVFGIDARPAVFAPPRTEARP
ncbi:MAG: putative inorganic carbon transporter subunit DabA [Halioglobus sp.]